ncbi:hypothetical protein [Antrihabitans cavernicola]|uniref:DUF2567 domain-containing protein n=1 Tax=Antrihabitans cavernicola TaxID=2495913 RepID=A0A5A7SFL3_9NOCA|nr:hypothetical protein [Spelaeibacter cavernicola]KAA0023467.1 hypothetical protein FOY51_08670 [Spelaeibacter cavernicola]
MPTRRFIAVLAGLGAVSGGLASLVWRYVDPPTFGNTYYATSQMQYEQFIEPYSGSMDIHTPWAAGWLTASVSLVALGAILFAVAGLWKSRAWRLVRDYDAPVISLVTFLAALGLLLGLCVSVAILALPPGTTLDGVGNRFQSFTLHLTDTDTLWWLTPLIGALLGCIAAVAATKLGWRLVRTGPVSQQGTV